MSVMSRTIREISRNGQGETSRYAPANRKIRLRDMAVSNLDLMARIEVRLQQLGISARRASLDSGMGADAIRDIGRKPDSSPTIATIEKLAIGLRTTPEWLAFDIDDRPASSPAKDGGLRVEGEVRAGSWLDVDLDVDGRVKDLDHFPSVPVNRDTRYPADSQFGLIVRGTSINRHAVEGDILACVEMFALNREIVNDELVVVERTRNAGHQLERTAKFYEKHPDHYKLWPCSTDKKYQEPLIVPASVGLGEADDKGEVISVRALVLWIHRPATRLEIGDRTTPEAPGESPPALGYRRRLYL